jgi:hypothetical protein
VNIVYLSRVECRNCIVATAVHRFRIDVEDTDRVCPSRCSKRALREVHQPDLFTIVEAAAYEVLVYG